MVPWPWVTPPTPPHLAKDQTVYGIVFGTLPIQNQVLQFSPPFPSLPPRASSRGSGQGAKVCPAQHKYIHSGAANSLLLQPARKQAKQ